MSVWKDYKYSHQADYTNQLSIVYKKSVCWPFSIERVCFLALSIQRMWLTVLVCFVSMEMTSANSGVCYTSVIDKAGYNRPYTTSSSYTYSTSCWSWSGRCSKTGTKYYGHYSYIGPTYKQASQCCSGYEGPNCIPICSPVCVSGNGECREPNKCTCFSSWTGETCRYDSNLLNWCSSISDNDIDNSPLPSVRSSLDVYCESKSSSIAYQPSQTAYVAPRLMNDSILALDQYKYHLYQFWKQHPYIRDPCCYSNDKYHQTLVQNLIKFDSEFYNLIGGLKESVAIELRKELETVCSTNSTSDVFCPIKAALHVIDAAAKLPPSKADWTLDTTKYTQAISVSIYILQKHNSDYSNISLPFTEHDLLVDCTNIILKYMQNKETEKLKAFAEYLPPASVYDAPLLCQTDSLCIFMKMVEQLRNYVSEIDLDENVITSDGKKRLILNTNTDYREFLRQKQLDRILTVLSEQGATSLEIANNLKKHTTTKFSEIRGYFEKVETFNQRIAEADINYVNDRIKDYQRDLKKLGIS